MGCPHCQGGGVNPELNPGQLVRESGKPLLTSQVKLNGSLSPAQYAPVIKFTYIPAGGGSVNASRKSG